MAEIHCLDARHPLRATALTTGQSFDIPEICGHHSRFDPSALLECILQLCQRGWDECTKVLESLELAIAAAHGDDRNPAGAARGRVLHRSNSPLDRFRGGDVRRAQPHEGAEADAVMS